MGYVLHENSQALGSIEPGLWYNGEWSGISWRNAFFLEALKVALVQELANLLLSMDVIDLSPLLYTNMPHWHTHPDVMIIENARNFVQNGYFLQVLMLPEHSGCHVDAPAHVLPERAEQTIDSFPVNALMGIAKKVDLSQENYAPGELVPLSKVQEIMQRSGLTFEKGDIAIFEFGWDKYLVDVEKKAPHERNWWGENEPGLARDTCRYLYECGVKAVGSDTAACDIAQVNGERKAGFGHGEYFLPHGIFIIEALYGLSRVPTTFYFIALPLKIKGGSGSPLRPIALVPKA
jgi:arylformamidase